MTVYPVDTLVVLDGCYAMVAMFCHVARTIPMAVDGATVLLEPVTRHPGPLFTLLSTVELSY